MITVMAVHSLRLSQAISAALAKGVRLLFEAGEDDPNVLDIFPQGLPVHVGHR